LVYLKHLCGGGGSTSLGKVRAHVTLKVEVSKGISLADLEKTGELTIRVNLASILLILKTMLTDILVDVTSHISACHLGARGLGEESGKLVTNASRLHETTGRAGAGLALTLGVSLLGNSKSAGPLLLESTILGLEGSKKGTHLLKLGEKLTRLGDKATINLRGSSLLNRGSRRSGRGLRLRSGSSGLGGSLSGLLSGSLSRGLGGSRGLGLGLGRLGCPYHVIVYSDINFLSGLTHYNI
tara:strand:- start:2786 stop:3505 length:720 start_codon:yes stop_codon:yes gene_type:complete